MSDEPITGLTEEQVQEQIAAAVKEQTAGLKKTNSELKAEKKTIQEELEKFKTLGEQIDALGGIEALKGLGDAETIKRLSELRKRFEADEQGKLLGEGKYDEWFDRRTEALRKDHASQLKKYEEKLAQRDEELSIATNALHSKVLETEVSSACNTVGVDPGAFLDVQLRAERTFKYDLERKIPVMRDKDGGIVFGKDGKTPKTITEWLEDQKEVSRHWWPASRGGGATGSTPGNRVDGDLSNLDMRQYAEKRREQGFGARHNY